MTGVDVIVIGGGAAGRAAAAAAAGEGLAALLIDEGPCPAATDGAREAGGSATAYETLVWSASPGFRVDALGPQRLGRWTARALVVATGARPRLLPFPGWTLPGVTTFEAARSTGARRILVAGHGPELAATAAALIDAGRCVVAVVDRGDAAEASTVAPDARLAAAGVPILRRHAVFAATSSPAGLAVACGPLDADGRRLPGGATATFEADGLAVGHGEVPDTAATRLLRAAHHFDPGFAAWRPSLDDCGRASLPGLYVAGGAAGAGGSATATGRLAGLAVACDLGRFDAAALAAEAQPVAAARASASAVPPDAAPRLAALADLAADTIICPCENLRRADIDAAAREGAVSLDQVKAFTRCGMGPCQGRICGDSVTGLLAARGIAPTISGLWTGRAPLRPLRLDRLVGHYGYADIALPPAAPL